MVSARPIEIERALDGVAGFFADRETRAGVVARRLFGLGTDADVQLADHLIRERRRRTRLDGSVDGALDATTFAAWELLQLGCAKGHAGLDRMVGFILAQQDQPGRFGEGCSPTRHQIGHCHHHLTGFFSPGGQDERLAPFTLPTGVVVDAEYSARFALSCFALRVVLQAGEERREAVRNHLAGLFHLAERWDTQEAFPSSPDLVFCAAAALAMAPLHEWERVRSIADHLVGQQQPDGRWPGVSLFHSLEAILLARGPAARDAVARAVPALLDSQQSDGSFDPTANEELALIAARVLRAQVPRRMTPRPHRRSSASSSLPLA